MNKCCSCSQCQSSLLVVGTNEKLKIFLFDAKTKSNYEKFEAVVLKSRNTKSKPKSNQIQ